MAGTMVTDQQLAAAIVRRLEWAPDVDARRIGVSVRDGVATLTGIARSVAEKRSAAKAGAEVTGLAGVIDEIVVPSAVGSVDDPELAASVRTELRNHPLLGFADVTVHVRHQVVHLHGCVNGRVERQAARRAAQAVVGVRTVIDELQLPPAPTASLTREHLAQALGPFERSGLENVDVRLDGRTAILEGNVRSWYERRAAERAARAVPGMADVRNELVVTF